MSPPRGERIAGEEAVGAELLATRDLIAHVGIAWDTAEQMGDLAARQARYLLDDYLTCAAAMAGRSDGDPAEQRRRAFENHIERRVGHVVEGVEQTIELLSTQSERAWDALFQLWSPFLAVVRQDWTRSDGDPYPTDGG